MCTLMHFVFLPSYPLGARSVSLDRSVYAYISSKKVVAKSLQYDAVADQP